MASPGLSSFQKARMQMDGWFSLTKILKESLIYGNHEASPKQMSGSVAFKFRVDRHVSYANSVQGKLIDPQSSFLKAGGVGSVVLGCLCSRFG